MKKKRLKIKDLLPGMEFKIVGSKNPGNYTLLVKYRQKGMSTRDERTMQKLEFPGSLSVFDVRDFRNR